MVDVIHRGHDRTMSGVIASEFVGHQPSRFLPLALDETTEKAFSRTLISATLYENINDIAVLIDSSIQIMSLSLHGDKDFVDVPCVAQPPLSFLEFAGIIRSKLLAPLANCFVSEDDPSLGQYLFDLTEAEAKPVVEPDGVTDNLRGKPITVVAGCLSFH